MRVIRASEIGAYLYCRRAWKYQRRDVPSENVQEMVFGAEIHRQHGRRVMAAGCLRTLALAMLLAAMVLFVAYLLRMAL
jgi:hypothetical protein